MSRREITRSDSVVVKQREVRWRAGDVQPPHCRVGFRKLRQNLPPRFTREIGRRIAARLLEDEVMRRRGQRFHRAAVTPTRWLAA